MRDDMGYPGPLKPWAEGAWQNTQMDNVCSSQRFHAWTQLQMMHIESRSPGPAARSHALSCYGAFQGSRVPLLPPEQRTHGLGQASARRPSSFYRMETQGFQCTLPPSRLTSRTASARRLTCTCTPSGPPAARLQRRCSYRPHGPPGEASGFVATECVRNPVNSVNWGFLQACATELRFTLQLHILGPLRSAHGSALKIPGRVPFRMTLSSAGVAALCGTSRSRMTDNFPTQ